MSDAVWSRSGSDTISRRAFYAVIGAVLTWGFVLTVLVSHATALWQPGIVMVFLVGLGIPIVGIVLSVTSDNPLVSFAGFNLVVGGLAAILGPVLAIYAIKAPGAIEEAATMTGFLTVVMGASGFLFPDFYRSIGGALLGALTAFVIVSIAGLFIPALHATHALDYIGVLLFSLYVGFDMWRASEMPATIDNAVDVSVALYLDIINLFLNLLSIFSDD